MQHRAQPGYTVRRLAPEEARAGVLALWGRVRRPSPTQDALFRWYYEHNPLGKASCFLLDSANAHDPVGMAGVGPRVLAAPSAGGELSAALLGDFQVDKHHRTLFPALTLQRAVKEWAHDQFQLLYGFPNASALPVLERLGFRRLARLTRWSFILRHAPYVEKELHSPILSRLAGGAMDGWRRWARPGISRALPDGFELERIGDPDARFDRLWRHRALGSAIMGKRDAAFVRWRFCARPDQLSEVWGLSARGTGELYAWAAVHVDGRAAHLRDLLMRSMGDARMLLNRLCGRLRAQGVESLSFVVQAPEVLRETLTSFGFRERDEQPRILIGFRGRDCPVDDEQLSARDGFYVTEADEDQ